MSRTTGKGWTGAALMVAVMAGCAGGTDDVVHETVVRDSSGILIVENGSGAPAVLHLSADPVLEIGELEGAPEYQLHNVRYVTALSDGTIVIANTGTDEIRFYDARGKHLRSVGGSGAGPGEFRNITQLRRLTGDTLMAYDSQNRRVSLFSRDGEYVRDFTPMLPDSETPARIDAASGNGALLVRAGSRRADLTATSFRRDTMEYQVLRGDSAHALRPYAGNEHRIEVEENESARMRMIMFETVPFGRSAYASGGPDGFYIGSSDTYEVHEYSTAGSLLGIIRSAHVAQRPVNEDVFAAYVDAALDARARAAESRGTPFDASATRQNLAQQSYAPSMPFYSELLAAEDGGVWVKDFALPWAEMPERWSVFSADRRLRGVIDMPPRFQPMHVTADRVIGVITDELDVQYVRVYTISG